MKYIKLFEEVNQEPIITYHGNGQKYHEVYFLHNEYHNEYHREDGPAVQTWYEDGQKQCDKYYLNGKLYREDGPAFAYWLENGKIFILGYYLNSKEYSREEWIEQLKKINSVHYEDEKAKYEAEKYNF